MDKRIEVEFEFGDLMVFADVLVEVIEDRGTDGSLLGPSEEYNGIISFDYTVENSDGDFVEGDDGCDERSHPNVSKEIDSYIATNWDNL